MIFLGLTIIELIALVIFLPLTLVFLAKEAFAWSVVITVLAVGLLSWFNWADITAFFTAEGAVSRVAAWAACYVLIGLSFSLVKWFFHSRKRAKHFSQFLANNCKSATGTLTERAEYAFGSKENGSHGTRCGQSYWESGGIKFALDKDGKFAVTYDAGELTEYVAAWTTWWPLFALLLVFEDFLLKFFDLVVEFFGDLYKYITTLAFKSVK
jgi:hypothetical protein